MVTEVPTIVRMGSTALPEHKGISINSINAVRSSSNKLTMKKMFSDAGINSPEYYYREELSNLTEAGLEELSFPILAKKTFRSRGQGMIKINNIETLLSFLESTPVSKSNPYYFERYYNYAREYRLHVSSLENCFYACRKMLKSEIPKEDRWFRNDSNSIWVLEDNPLFNIPETWEEIKDECIRALDVIGLDIAAMDVIVSKSGEFKILESNSAPSFGTITPYRYMEVINRLYNKKIKEQNLCVD
jgi:glutathione synthase/RimK-type ligase-like ATP-grasp enzyme